MTESSHDRPSIVDGVDAVIDRWLGVPPIGRPPHYRHRATAQVLSGRSRAVHDPYALIAEALHAIERMWVATRATSTTHPSVENWRFAQQLKIAPHNRRPEVTLERRIVALSPDWANQVPTASGLSGATRDRARNIDLVHRDAAETYTWYELKVDSDTPLYAAMEILVRGLLYLFTRRHLAELGYDPAQKELLRARTVHLHVLAPTNYYAGFNFRWLETALNDGLRPYLATAKDVSITMDFEFWAFPRAFRWPCEDAALRQALVQMARV